MNPHYSGRALFEALCDALGYDVHDRMAATMVRHDLAHALKRPVPIDDFRAVLRGFGLMDDVLTWCAVAGINVIKLHGERAKFDPSIPEGPEHTVAYIRRAR